MDEEKCHGGSGVVTIDALESPAVDVAGGVIGEGIDCVADEGTLFTVQIADTLVA